MANTYSSSLRLIIQQDGTNQGTWGGYTNTNIASLIEQAITGVGAITVSGSSNYTLTVTNGASDEARNAVLNITGTLTAAINVICPTAAKTYVVKNGTTGGFAITLKTSAGTGISVPNGETTFLYCDGTNVVRSLSAISGIPGAFTTLSASSMVSGAITITGAYALRGSYGAGAVGSNFAAGDGALLSNTTGAQNAAVGYQTLLNNTTGIQNAAMGSYALYSNTTGNSNAAVGFGALYNNTTGAQNAAVGVDALYNNTTGNSNAAMGVDALHSNTTGYFNAAMGFGALYSNTTGYNNAAMGSYALYSNTTGNSNAAAGDGALRSNTTGAQNAAMGYQALYSNTTGNSNAAVGYQALLNNTTGYFNAAVGYQTLLNNTTGIQNAAMGVGALYSNTTGYNNAAMGYQALYSNTTGNSNAAMGYQALYSNTTGSGNSAFNPIDSAGTYAPVFNPTTENNRFCMGSTGVTNAYIKVAWTVVSDARDKTNFAPVPHGLEFVNQLKPTAYQFKEDRETDVPTGIVRYGFKAQDILELEGDTPVIIDNEDLDKLRFNSDSLIPVLVNAIKELSARLEILEGK